MPIPNHDQQIERTYHPENFEPIDDEIGLYTLRGMVFVAREIEKVVHKPVCYRCAILLDEEKAVQLDNGYKVCQECYGILQYKDREGR